jgi:CAAX prenyl protease-like protein
MRLLTAPFDPAARGTSALVRPLLGIAGVTVAGIGIGLAIDGALGGGGLGSAIASGWSHAGLIAGGWVVALGDAPGWRRPACRVAGLLVVASVAARLVAAGAALYLLVPLLLAREAAQAAPRLRWIGWVSPPAAQHVVVGAGAGAFLGLHLLIAASMTLGYTVSLPSLRAYSVALAYDVGVNALSAEWLFRGALFSALWRRWSFWPAAAAATGAALVRYLVDPALPRAIEVAAGAIFYLTLLGLASCALRAWSGSLLPGYVATVVFFAAYRALHA